MVLGSCAYRPRSFVLLLFPPFSFANDGMFYTKKKTHGAGHGQCSVGMQTEKHTFVSSGVSLRGVCRPWICGGREAVARKAQMLLD